MRILVVEDDPSYSLFLSRALGQEGHAVDTAFTGDEARRLIAAHPYDVIVLDLQLPDCDGVEMLRRLRGDGVQTPVMVLTGRQEVADIVLALDVGADEYLGKPADVSELKARIRALSRRGGGRESLVLRFGNVVLDLSKREVQVEGKPLPLTPREFSLLQCLLGRPAEVVPRAELLQKVWQTQLDPDSNLVDVHISRLRSKLHRSGARVSLESVRGVGFSLTDRSPSPDEPAV